MRENRPYGSEGGARFYSSLLPLSGKYQREPSGLSRSDDVVGGCGENRRTPKRNKQTEQTTE